MTLRQRYTEETKAEGGSGETHAYVKWLENQVEYIDAIKEGAAVRIADLEQELVAMTERSDRLYYKIRFWSYCTWRGMRVECPEQSVELRECFRELGIDPYASETSK